MVLKKRGGGGATNRNAMPSQNATENDPKCCICASPLHKCTTCKCVQQKRPCHNCRKGDECQNPFNRRQNRVGERGRPGNRDESQDEDQGQGGEMERRTVNSQPQAPQPQSEPQPSSAPLTTPAAPSSLQTPTPPHRQHQVPHLAREDVQNERGDFSWKDLTKDAATCWVDDTYLEIAGWSANNFFQPPKCTATTNIIKEMVVLLNNYNQNTPMAALALKTFFILPKLFFQKPHNK